MLGAIPARHRVAAPDHGTSRGWLDRYFAMARGTADAAPLEMTKWFDTNYHYLVPELGPDTEFVLDPTKPLGEFREALAVGIATRPVIVGPITFLTLAKAAADHPDFEPMSLLPRLIPIYRQLLSTLRQAGANWVQLDEPTLVTDQPLAVLEATRAAYDALAAQPVRPQLLVATYFDRLGPALPLLRDSDIEAIGLDFTGPAAANLVDLAQIGGLGTKRLVAGVISGRNIWRADLADAAATLMAAAELAGRVDVAASCSLLHVPLDVADERELPAGVAEWLAFARQKLDEVAILARGLIGGTMVIEADIRRSAQARADRLASPLVNDPQARARAAAVTDADLRRDALYTQRREVQRRRFALPPLPTTTIGSFPQTTELRQARAARGRGELTAAQYDEAMRAEIRRVIALQEDLGLDVLVHGEPERNDMVQYFAEQLQGFIATSDGWVQSYGTRYVRPPIILGDVARPTPMTVEWTHQAQRMTAKPVKGMLTGPVTMLAWSFVRDDQPEADTARQIALALRAEVIDLQDAGIGMIQVDEPALRETLPLRTERRSAYLAWAVEAFRLSTGAARPDVQVHTHMCYAEFGDVLQAIIDMDADVISLEAARSQMAIVADLSRAGYPNEVGPGVWDIHSPRVPSVSEIAEHLRVATAAFPPERLWVNPDCGLKTRGYPEVESTLANLVAATTQARERL